MPGSPIATRAKVQQAQAAVETQRSGGEALGSGAAARIGTTWQRCRCIAASLASRRLDAARHQQRWNASCTPQSRRIEALLETHQLPVKEDAMDKVRKQLAGLSALVDFWWQRVWQDLAAQWSLTPSGQQWVEECLLPLMYWQAPTVPHALPTTESQDAQALEAVQDGV